MYGVVWKYINSGILAAFKTKHNRHTEVHGIRLGTRTTALGSGMNAKELGQQNKHLGTKKCGNICVEFSNHQRKTYYITKSTFTLCPSVAVAVDVVTLIMRPILKHAGFT